MRHIEITHPTYEKKSLEKEDKDQAPNLWYSKFSIFDNLGALKPNTKFWPKQSPTEMSKQLGIGPTLFLMSTKAMSWFFLVLTIINFPVMFFYYSGNAAEI